MPSPPIAEDGDRVAWRDARLAERMQRGRGGAHEDRALLERDRVWQRVRVLRRHADEFRIAAIAVLADHLPGRAELLAPGAAVAAFAAGDEVVQAYALARAVRRDIGADGFDDASDLVAERERMASRTDAGAVVRIRMADPRRLHAHEYFTGARGGGGNALVRKRPAGRRQADGAEIRERLRRTSCRNSSHPEGTHPFIFVKGTRPFVNMKGCVPLDMRQGGIGPRPAVAACNPPATRGF